MDPAADFVAYWSDACRATGGTVETGAVVRMYGPPGNLPVCGVLRFEGNGAAAKEEAMIWQEKGAPFSFVTADDEVARVLSEQGLEVWNDFVLVRRAVEDLGLPYHEVTWVGDAAPFAQVQARVHGIPDEVLTMVRDGWDRTLRSGRVELAVVFQNGSPVGCGALYLGNGNAGMYAAGVLEPHRRRGIGRSLAQARMARALELGMGHAVACTTPDGLALCRSLGYEETGRLKQFVWSPRSDDPS